MKVTANKSMMTNRRLPTPLIAQREVGRSVHAPPLLPAAVAYLVRYMRAAGVRVWCMFGLLLCVQGLCQTSEQTPWHQLSVNSLQILVGTFESAVRGDSLFGDRTSTNGVPLFTLTLETNGTYSVFCARVFIVPLIDGGGSVVPGYEFGAWRRGGDRYHPEVVLTATNRTHMAEAFPTHMRVDLRDLNRLTAINIPPSTNLMLWHPWVPLSPPYFYRKLQ